MIKNIRLIFTCLLLEVTLGFVLGCSGNSSCPAPNSKEIFISTKGKGDVPIEDISFFMELDRSIFLQYDGGAKERQGFAFVDKATRESRAINRFIFEDGFVYRPEYLYPLPDGWCAMLLYPEDIFKNSVFAQRFPGLDEESNPVLFLGKLR